jgi:hypothetical protein
MKKAVLFIWIAAAASRLQGAEVSPLKAREISVCEAVVDRACRGAAKTFAAEVEWLTFLTRIDGATGDAFVTHVWRFEGNEVRKVNLPIRTSSYRTWSSKRVLGTPGKWSCEVLDPLGRSLGVVDFVVEPPKRTQ